MKRFLWCLLILTGCTAGVEIRDKNSLPPNVPSVTLPSHPWHEMIVFVPQTDDAAATWLKWFNQYPQLRMVIAMSPRFQRVLKEPQIKAQIQMLQKEGRIELALQIPNAPLLPLLMESPPYGYSDDIIQLIAQSKAGFFKQWNSLPHGLVLPYGAASPKLVTLLERLGFSWVVGAFEVPAIDGFYQSGSLALWDGTPASKPIGTVVHVWDERQAKDKPLDAWMKEMKEKSGTCILPQDPRLEAVSLDPRLTLKTRTWVDPNVSLWVGQPDKDAAWQALRSTRELLEKYKNSGQASVQKLDVAFEEIYSAQNSNYFASFGNALISPALAEERQHEFQATLSAVYRVIGQAPPEDLFKTTASGTAPAVRISSTTIRAESFPEGREHVLIEEAVGDSLIPNGPDLKSLEVFSATDSIHWSVTLSTMVPASVDIYLDLNGQPNAGTPSFLQGRRYVTAPNDTWEYAIALSGQTATLYQTQSSGTYGAVRTFPVIVEGNSYRVTIPRELMRGSPKRWGYQVLVMNGAVLSDFIDPLEISQKELWKDLSTEKRNDIPFVRFRPK